MNMKMANLMGFLLISMLLSSISTVTVPRAFTSPSSPSFEYPPIPLLKVTPKIVIGKGLTNTFVVNVSLMGEGGVDLDPFWDVTGFDILMNFRRSEPPYLILKALNVIIDPDGWFAAFWPSPWELGRAIDNDAGTVHVVFLGVAYKGVHTAPYGRGRLFTVTFQEIYESGTYPPPSVEITLRNPRLFVLRSMLDADAGLVDLTSPVGTQWHATTPYHGTPFSLDNWVDLYPDGKLGPGDDLILTDTNAGLWHHYSIHDIKGTLELTQHTPYVDDYIWMADFTDAGLANNGLPGRTATGGTGAAYNGFGTPYWTGNFSLTYPINSVNQIVAHFLPFTDDEYTQVLTESVDYKVYPDEDLVELLKPLDVPIINEHWVDGVNNTLNGWPYINYVASGIESVYRKFPAYNEYYGETEGFATNNGYAMEPPSEWWFDPEWPWELEGWWALGYGGLAGDWTWPSGTEWWINYTAASYLTVDFSADIDLTPHYVEFPGTYEGFLALGDPIGTTWNEVYPNSLRDYTLVDWTDSDSSGDITIGDYINLGGAVIDPTFRVDKLATDIIVDQLRSVDDVDLTSPFYGMERIVDVVGFPHLEREMSPWHNRYSCLLLPHVVEDGLYKSTIKLVGGSMPPARARHT